jgi:hypothetical protein
VGGTDPERVAPDKAAVRVGLKRVTTYLGGWLTRLSTGSNLQDLVPVQFDGPTRCLFAAAGNQQTLVHIDGDVTDNRHIEDHFQWKEAQDNAYDNYPQMMDQTPRNPDTMGLPGWDKGKWQIKTSEPPAAWYTQERVLKTPPDSDRGWTRLTPRAFREGVSSSLKNYGADLARLTTPAADAAGSDTIDDFP